MSILHMIVATLHVPLTEETVQSIIDRGCEGTLDFFYLDEGKAEFYADPRVLTRDIITGTRTVLHVGFGGTTAQVSFRETHGHAEITLFDLGPDWEENYESRGRHIDLTRYSRFFITWLDDFDIKSWCYKSDADEFDCIVAIVPSIEIAPCYYDIHDFFSSMLRSIDPLMPDAAQKAAEFVHQVATTGKVTCVIDINSFLCTIDALLQGDGLILQLIPIKPYPLNEQGNLDAHLYLEVALQITQESSFYSFLAEFDYAK